MYLEQKMEQQKRDRELVRLISDLHVRNYMPYFAYQCHLPARRPVTLSGKRRRHAQTERTFRQGGAVFISRIWSERDTLGVVNPDEFGVR
jgi:hypothetical protein